MARHALLLNFALINAVAIGLVLAAWLQGWLDGFAAPTIWTMSLAILSVFVWGLIACGVRLWRLNTQLHLLRDVTNTSSGTGSQLRAGSGAGAGTGGGPDDRAVSDDRAISTADPAIPDQAGALADFQDTSGRRRLRRPEVVQMQLGNEIGHIRHLSNALVFLGLIGTVIGFIIGLSGIDAAQAGDVNKVGAMITQLITGMSVALYTTLLGALLNLWLNVNIRLLTTGAVQLLARLSDYELADGAN